MNLKISISLLASATLSFANDDAFMPHRITHESLVADTLLTDNNSILVDSLSKDGLVSITGIPGFGTIKRSLMSYLHACIMDQGTDVAPQQIFEDGTIRRTLGTVTVPGAGPQPLILKEVEGQELSQSCQAFNAHVGSFRQSVDETTAAFADRLTFEMGHSLSSPLMSTQDGSHDFDSIKDIVKSGEHLEHFHSYQKTPSTSIAGKRTIDLHTDQGMFIALTPGLLVTHGSDQTPDLSQPLVESEGFYIQTSDGKLSLVQVDAADDLIFMIGDGVNQYVNTHLKADSTSAQKRLRATPHAVSLVTHDDSLARVWYGRMVLPPKDAYSALTDTTYGDTRDQLIKTLGSQAPGVGCSSMTMRALSEGGDGGNSSGAAEDADGGCASNQIYCWFRCMDLEPYDMDNTTCSSQNLQTQCVNPRGQVVPDGKKHGDFFPMCTNSTENVTDYPAIEPDQGVSCASQWNTFMAKSDGYDHHVNLTTEKTSASFMWSLDGDKVKARLTFDGLFGWLSAGFVNLEPDARHNGMNGADIILAVPGGQYSAATGLNTDAPTTVKEYVIDKDGSSFRHWADPVDGSNPNANVKFDGCHTELTFEVDNINGRTFNTTGSDMMMWAGNGADYFMGYHGRNRARFIVEWSTGVAYFAGDERPVMEGNGKSSLGGLAIGLIAGGAVAVLGVAAFALSRRQSSPSPSEETPVGEEKFEDESHGSKTHGSGSEA